jgi:ABC-type phosphate/phosphonate transport system permease subunit
MHTTLQLMDLAKERLALAHNLPLPMTDYRLAKLMSFNERTVSNWRTGKSHISGEFAHKFALACELPEAYVYACIELERTSNESVRHILEAIANAFTAKAGAAMVAAMLLFGGAPNQAHADGFNDSGLYIMRRKRRTLRLRRTETQCA